MENNNLEANYGLCLEPFGMQPYQLHYLEMSKLIILQEENTGNNAKSIHKILVTLEVDQIF